MHHLTFASFPLPLTRSLCYRQTRLMSSMNRARMTSDKSAVNAFLRSSRTHVTHDSSAASIYLGNEACDLDSVASALALAYAKHASGSPSVAVLNVQRDELRLRRDVMLMLQDVEIDTSALTFVDEINLNTALSRGGGLTLVDHNELALHQRELSSYVIRIVDHHADKGEHTGALRLIERTGSCASIVSQSIADDANIPPPLAYLLLAAVLVDTSALQSQTLPRDIAAAERLGRIAELPKELWNGLFKRVKTARNDADGFSARELLLKDYKCFAGSRGRVGIASVGGGLLEWTLEKSRPLCTTVLEQVRLEKAVECLMVMTNLMRDDQFCREVLIFGETDLSR